MNTLLPEIHLLNVHRLKQLVNSALEEPQVESALILSTNGAIFSESYCVQKPMRSILNDAASLAAAYNTHIRTRTNGNVNSTESRSNHARDTGSEPIVYESRTYTAVITRVAQEILLAVMGRISATEIGRNESMPNGVTHSPDGSIDEHTSNSSRSEHGPTLGSDEVQLHDQPATETSEAPHVDPSVLEALDATSQELTQELRRQLRNMRCPEDF